ncbi:beta-N-acetylglucosaminidase domain-containing protein [Streptomyces sp. Je 1-369]|uniref:beta-N-acetylglucosaminidase domain-containing protein n=1 Tax=Streptomyces sp. Je 1-369 TaxID=2966192 RepID=UPI002286B1FA|nr:beta-N-acetylglucosaminidase domain-containing protein [Streptomyces sp. Je 1-369]WAL95547.1 beta-N-acetylglucosaminidase domain-containing protein [Streptomyces sp. Je 1-369]
MQLRRRKGAAAVAVAVIAGALGGAPGALADPGAPGGPGAPVTLPDDDATAGASRLPPVWPRPQSMTAAGTAVTIGDDVVLVVPRSADGDHDPYAVKALRDLLHDTGARHATEVRDGDPLPAGDALVVRAGGTGADRALRSLGARERGDLPRGGYRLAVGRVEGRATVALDGTGDDGLFHGVQTLRQLTRTGTPGASRTVPGVRIRDWPGTAVRGLTEGFYGTPWTREQRLAQLDFMGRTKQNRYLYAPGDDPYRQARWREPYPADQRADFRALAKRAEANHVTLAWAVSPGQAMCLSSDRDVRDLTRKIDAMWALGVRAFQLQFQNVSYSEWHCEQDAETFGSGPEAAAKAQARVADAVAAHLAARHPGAGPLSLMPTEYFQDGTTEYRAALSRALDRRIEVAWTGVGVVPRTITGRELAGARKAFGPHPLVTMDNYPVNDFAQDRIFLGPYTGREPAVASGSAALLGNAMEQPSASRIPLFTAADYAWNPRAYRPHESWLAAIDDLAGGDAKARGALRALAGNDASSVLGADESAYLRPLMDGFWAARATTTGATTTGATTTGATTDRARDERAAKALRAAFTVMREAPRRLADSELDGEVRPWIEQLARYGEAGETAVDLLAAQSAGDGAAAWRGSRALTKLQKELRRSGVTVGEGVLDPFLARTQKAYAAWAGTGENQASSSRGATARFDRARPLTAVTALTDPGTEGTVEAHVPGKGWQRVGALARSGFTELNLHRTKKHKDLRADAIRINARGDSVRHLVPWFADTPDARLSLSRTEADAEIGGGPLRISAKLRSLRPGDVTGTLRAKAPRGIEVKVPGTSTSVPRGTEVDVPLEITVPPGTRAGTYDIPLTFGASEDSGASGDEPRTHTHTLSVRAFPRTAGPDLARGAKASSSGDETKDFPASAAVDGDPETRWSSPAEDGAWWQVELAEPVRLGQVVLRWQDAYAAGYRVQTSADGRTWRTAATVRDGRGGRESVRMDARDTRFIRVQGDRRGTRFGYSLWSLEAYAVADK